MDAGKGDIPQSPWGKERIPRFGKEGVSVEQGGASSNCLG